MRCNNKDLIMYVYDELTGKRRLELERHLATCTDCSREAGALRATTAAIRDSAPLPGPSPELEERILNDAATILTRPVPLWQRLFSLPRTGGIRLALMSGVAALLLLTTLLLQEPTNTDALSQAVAWNEAFLTELTAEVDGSGTVLNADEALLKQLDTDMEQLTMALASY